MNADSNDSVEMRPGTGFDPAATQVEQLLFELDSVHDCKVMRRGSGRLVAYVVPAASVHTDRIGEWLVSLKTLTGSDFIAVSRLPLTDDGEVDEAELSRLPLLDDDLARRCEERLRALPGVRDAVVMVAPEQEQLPPIHSSALLLEHPVEAQVPRRDSPLRAPAATPGLAISHGAELERAEQLPRSLPETLQRAAREHPEHGLRTIGIDGTERFLSYPELLAQAQQLLGGLRGAGLQPGDRIIFQFKHNQDFLIAFWACCLGGFVPVPLAASHGGMNGAAKLQNAWETVEARLVLTTSELAPIIQIFGQQFNVAGLPELRVECVDELATTAAPGAPHVGEPDGLALMMLTSGSTGQPKGVMLSHRNLIRRSAGSAQMNGFSSGMVTLNWMPLDHVAGIIYFHLRDVFLGCQQIHAATDLVLQDPLIWPEWVDRYRVTATFAPNFAFGLLNDRAAEIHARARKSPRAWDLSCLRCVLNGAEAIVPRTARRFLQLFAPYGLPSSSMWPVWGMSETSSGTTYSETFRLESSHDDDALVEVGRPIPGLSIRIVDQNGQPMLERTVGSLQVKGEVITAGYYNRPDLNAESFTPDGWFKTGDLGCLADGRLTITGREKDVIVVNGVNYLCHEIEGLVEEIDEVETSYTAACAVRDSETNTDRLAIFFHPKAGCERVSLELIKTIRGAVARRLGVSPDYLLPVEREAIPKTNIGKIQRTQLAASFAKGEFVEVVRRVEVLAGGTNTIPNWFFRPVWRRAELRGRREAGSLVVFADSHGLGECLERQATAAGHECVLVVAGSEFAEDGPRITIDPANGQHYRRLVETLMRRDIVPRSIVHLWTYGGTYRAGARDTGVLSVLRLVQALHATRATRLLVAGSPEAAIENAALLGLLKTIPQENPKIACCHLELPIADDDPNAARVTRELSSQARDAEVAYRSGKRWVRRLRRADLAAEAARPLPIEKGGLYLLSGGVGGLGREIASYLLERFQARLILLGRSKSEESLRPLETLAATSGGEVSHMALDVGDYKGIHAVVQQAEKRWERKLSGVFHLAGVYHECPIAEETSDSVAEVLHPKLQGTLALHQLIEERPGALFVSFSSVNGFFGGYGVSAYAANSFLEGFSEYQRSLAQNDYCISWSLWDEVGMSRGYAMKNAARGRGFYALSPRQGLTSLWAILQRPPSHTCVGLDGSNLHIRRSADDLSLAAQSLVALVSGDIDPELRIQDRYGVPVALQLKRVPATMLDAAGRIDRERSHAGGQIVSPEGELESAIASVWRKVLNIEQLGVTDNFFDLGGNSLAMGQANGLLQEILKRKISMTEMFQYSTVRALAAHLSAPEKSVSSPELNQSQSRGEQRRQMTLARRRG